MAKKLFALETESTEEDSGLLIDKVLQNQQAKKPGLMLTSELIKQRHRLKDEIQKEIGGASDEESKEEGEDDSGDDEEPKEDKKDQVEEEKTDDAEEEDGKEEEEEEEEPKKETKTDGDEVDEANDKEGLKSLVGSGLKEGDDGKKDKEEKEATESFSPKRKKKVARESLFAGIRKTHDRYKLALEGYVDLPKPATAKETPVVYVKEDVLKGLQELLTLSATYVAKNTKKTTDIKEGLLKLAESVSIYREYNNNEKLDLTMKVVDDEDLVKAVAMPGVGGLKGCAATMDKYMGKLSGCLAKLVENNLDTVKTVFSSSGFTEKEGVMVFDKILPGFNLVSASMTEYVDYLHVDYANYQIFNSKNFKVQDLYSIGGLTIDKPDDFTALLKSLDGVTVHIGIFMDNLSDLSVQYNELIATIKALHYDVDTEKVKNLSEIDVDSKLKDFIKFKMLSEGYTVCTDICMGFLTSVTTAISKLVVVGEKSGEIND